MPSLLQVNSLNPLPLHLIEYVYETMVGNVSLRKKRICELIIHFDGTENKLENPGGSDIAMITKLSGRTQGNVTKKTYLIL